MVNQKQLQENHQKHIYSSRDRKWKIGNIKKHIYFSSDREWKNGQYLKTYLFFKQLFCCQFLRFVNTSGFLQDHKYV